MIPSLKRQSLFLIQNKYYSKYYYSGTSYWNVKLPDHECMRKKHAWGSKIYYILFGIALMGNRRPLWTKKIQLARKADNFHLKISCMKQCHLFCYMCTFVGKLCPSKNFFRISYTHFQTTKSLCCYYSQKQIILAWTFEYIKTHTRSLINTANFNFSQWQNVLDKLRNILIICTGNNQIFWSYNHYSLHKSRTQDFLKHYAGGKESIENTNPKEKPLSFCTWNRNLMNPPLIFNNIFVTSPKVSRVWNNLKLLGISTT